MQNIHTEISQDSRLLIFAAFNDQGKVVERLLDAGFELRQLDCLVHTPHRPFRHFSEHLQRYLQSCCGVSVLRRASKYGSIAVAV